MLSSHLVTFRCPVLDNNFPCHKVPKVYYAIFGYVTIKVSDVLLDCDTVQSYKRTPTFSKIILLPSSGFMCVMQETCSVIYSDSNRTHGRVVETGSQSMQMGTVDRKGSFSDAHYVFRQRRGLNLRSPISWAKIFTSLEPASTTGQIQHPTHFNTEDRGTVFFRYVVIRLQDYTVSQSENQ